MPPQILFHELDGYAAMENQKRTLKDAVAAAPELMSSRPDDDVVEEFVAKYDIDVPVIFEDRMTMTEREVDVDVSHDPRRLFRERGKPFYIKGTEVTVHIPFSGEPIFFRVQPNYYSSSPPRGFVEGQELLIQFTFPNDQPPTDLKASLDREVAGIKQYLERLREMGVQLRNELRHIARQAWQLRKSHFAARSQVVSGLGIPRRVDPSVSIGQLVSTQSKDRRNSTSRAKLHTVSEKSDEWDALISHASEDKVEIAQPLAEALREKGLRVWYDEYTLTVGDRLRRKIDEGLAKSRFGIVILSPSFFSKHWPQQELDGLAAREVDGVKVILPVWHDIDRQQVAAYSPMLADRMAVASRKGLARVVEELTRAMNI
jgi:hypothetical protein